MSEEGQVPPKSAKGRISLGLRRILSEALWRIRDSGVRFSARGE